MHLAMCLDFSLRFQRSPGTASHLPCYLLWFRFFGSWVKFQDSADQIPPPSPLWEPELPHKMLTSGAYTRSDQKRILSSEHIIPTCTLERIMDPRVEVLRRRGYQAHFTQPREAAVCWRPGSCLTHRAIVHTGLGRGMKKGTIANCSHRGHWRRQDEVTSDGPLCLPASKRVVILPY